MGDAPLGLSAWCAGLRALARTQPQQIFLVVPDSARIEFVTQLVARELRAESYFYEQLGIIAFLREGKLSRDLVVSYWHRSTGRPYFTAGSSPQGLPSSWGDSLGCVDVPGLRGDG